jgi:hypothetical protein
MGDGKNWGLIVEPTDNLPRSVDPLELAEQCQSKCVMDAAKPTLGRDDLGSAVGFGRRIKAAAEKGGGAGDQAT